MAKQKTPEEKRDELLTALRNIEIALEDSNQNTRDCTEVIRKLKVLLFPEENPSFWARVRKYLTNK